MAKKFHSEAEKEVYELLEDMIENQHHDLGDNEFQIMYKHGGWMSKGKTVFARVKVLGDDLRRLLHKDVILYLNADMWKVMSAPQKRYVLDHTLYTLVTKEDKHGETVFEADGRPKLTTLPPDIEGFVEVIKRHGPVAEDVKRLTKALKETNQLTFDDLGKEQEEGEQPPQEPREGKTGTIDQNGVVDVDPPYDEKNQVTIDQVASQPEDKGEGGSGPEGDMSTVPPISGDDDDLPY